MRSASRYGSGRSSTVRVRLKIAALTPKPIASVATATAVKPGRAARARNALLRAIHMWLQDRRDELVDRRRHSRLAADAHDRTAQPRQLQPLPALEIFEHRRLHVRRQCLVRTIDIVEHGIGYGDTRRVG